MDFDLWRKVIIKIDDLHLIYSQTFFIETGTHYGTVHYTSGASYGFNIYWTLLKPSGTYALNEDFLLYYDSNYGGKFIYMTILNANYQLLEGESVYLSSAPGCMKKLIITLPEGTRIEELIDIESIVLEYYINNYYVCNSQL